MQGEELAPAREKAEAAGVKDIFIDDLREEFVRDYVFPMFRSVLCFNSTALPGQEFGMSVKWADHACLACYAAVFSQCFNA